MSSYNTNRKINLTIADAGRFEKSQTRGAFFSSYAVLRLAQEASFPKDAESHFKIPDSVKYLN